MKEKKLVLIEIRAGHPEDGIIERFGYPQINMSCPKCHSIVLDYIKRTNEYRCAYCHKGMTNTIKRRIGQQKFKEIHS